MQMDLTFVHAPATYDFRERSIMTGPVSDMVPSTPIFEMYPLGLTTLGEYLERHGISVRLYNLAFMMLHRKRFDVESHLAKLDSTVFGIDLHWMPHCHGSIEVAKIIKRLHPDSYIEFGGLSSSIFHEDLIKYDFIDFVFRGDSTEEPMRRLMARIKQARITKTPLGDLSDIPNLTWKDETGAIHINPLSWVPDTMDAISLDYAYPMKGVIRHRDLMSYVPFKGWLQYPACASLTSRGCNRNCATCGGSNYAYRNHFGRQRIAWRDPKLLINDVETIQNHICGPVFVLNDFLQAGHEYTHEFITGLKGKLRNPIGFEFFGPPAEGTDFYDLLDDNLPDWSVEISAESHDDDVRAAFGKGHYKMTELEDTIIDALSHKNCSRFDLYFMTGIPKQTAASVRETGEYVKHLYERVGYDPRLVVMTSPMAPFLDVGSIAFDNPAAYGYKLRARTFEEHRERMILPSWKHIMNYESVYMSPDEMCDATYDAAIDINRIKGAGGIISAEKAAQTDKRIRDARAQMARLDEELRGSTAPVSETMAKLKDEFDRLNENTVAEKSDLEWPHALKFSHVVNLAKFTVAEVGKNINAALHGNINPASSEYPYPEQTQGVVSTAYRYAADGTPVPRNKQSEIPATRGSVNAPGFVIDSMNSAFAVEYANLAAGIAGVDARVGVSQAISKAAAAAVGHDAILERVVSDES